MSSRDEAVEKLHLELDSLRSEVENLRQERQTFSGDDTASLRLRLAASRAAHDRSDLLASAVRSALDPIAVLTPAVEEEGPRVAYVNAAFNAVMGMRAEEALAQTFSFFDFIPADLGAPLTVRFLAGLPFRCEGMIRRRDATAFAAEITASPAIGTNGWITHWIVYVRDTSEIKARMLALERQSQYDSLTMLPNRVLLFDRLEQSMLSFLRHHTHVCLMILDLDHFKEINDTRGHQMGDVLLKEVGERIRTVIRRSDTVARLGGDEFAILAPDISGIPAALSLAQKVTRAFELPFVLGDDDVSIGCSLGLAICPDHGTQGQDLVRRADFAMYRAKHNGGGIQIFELQDEEEASHRLELASDLRSAIPGAQIVVHYQPLVRMDNGVVDRVEALARWEHPRFGLLPPDRFISIAEETGLIRPLTLHVLDVAMRQCREWRDAGMAITVAVNLSVSSLLDSALPEATMEILDRYDLPADALLLEITETGITSDPERTLAILSLLNAAGIGLSIDDFGTGYSSLAKLRQIPFDEIKIDRSFVAEMAMSESDRTIVRAAIELAHNLGRRVVAEGVEDEVTHHLLRELGCDYTQGFLCSKPLPGSALTAFLAANGPV